MLIRYAGRCSEETKMRVLEEAGEVRKIGGIWVAIVNVGKGSFLKDTIKDVTREYEKELTIANATFVFIRSESEGYWDEFVLWIDENYIERWVNDIIDLGLTDELGVSREAITTIAKWFANDLVGSYGSAL